MLLIVSVKYFVKNVQQFCGAAKIQGQDEHMVKLVWYALLQFALLYLVPVPVKEVPLMKIY